ncbi:MAG: hypothetical protein JNN05_00015 [Candidatus Omnitrophica bacterium]|nr:hypothetical protein [Candidatus Omnitrophota bacterium]
MKINKIMLPLILSIFVLTGCTVRLTDFTIISTKNIDLSKASSFERGKTRVEGKDEVSIIIIIPTGVPSIKEAIDRAIESVPGGIALVDGVISMKQWWFIMGSSSYVVEGTPLIDTTMASNQLKSNFMVAKLDTNGIVNEFKFVSKEDYKTIRSKYVR